ncbi:MAG: hypothetical protein EHM79_10960 [Geobacter sp.]|nr:MAG: hypothetical protein EHM79_10960 [Geobacter sp.]
MTLCTAWVRQINNTDELVFATDSTLTGGEKWDHGIKLFELPRKDCLLCFAGQTGRAYPLILNLVSSLQFNKLLENPETSISEILNHVSELFTSLIKTVVSEIRDENIHELRGSARFLFGGWCWQSNSFRIWKLYYSEAAEGFLFDELTSDSSKTRFYTFMGEAKNIDIEKDAKDRFRLMLLEEDSLDSKLDMEPLRVLRDIAVDSSIREVGGSLQIAKVYKSGKSEFFGIYWPSIKGNPCFQGREHNEYNKPSVRYFSPDTFDITDLELPERLAEITEVTFKHDTEFMRECYPEGEIRGELSDGDKQKVKTILKEIAYARYLQELNTDGEVDE